MPTQKKVLFSGVLTVCLLLAGQALAIGPDLDALQESRQRGVQYLKQHQRDDGSWTAAHSPGITALALHALLQSGVSIDDAVVKRGFDHLLTHLKPDGGIYDENSLHKNYETSIAIMAFQSANQDGRYDEVVQPAVAFLKEIQWNEKSAGSRQNPAFGGAGYGKHQRPDLSNTTFFVEALRKAGVSDDDPAIQNALTFISRTQNLDSEFNDTEWASKIDDGGFYYSPAAGGSSQAGQTPDGGLRSYASMTYAGLKSMIYAGLDQDDPRVKAASDWIRRYYTLDENPGMGQQGLYYYYHTFAKTLSVLDVDVFVEADGTRHDWRKELAEHLFEVQNENGSWINPTDRWYEGDPNLVTSYALLALEHCQPNKGQALDPEGDDQ